mgnify:CR=1 FL=1
MDAQTREMNDLIEENEELKEKIDMSLYDIVKKLNGKIDLVGSSHIDKERFKNLENMCELVNELLVDINRVAADKENHQHSVQKAGCYAAGFLKELK